jgi:hypothetical protein
MMRPARWLAIVMFAWLAAACDGLFTGEQVARFPLQAGSGGYAPITLSLGPQMNPVALNFAAGYAASATEAGKWNRYRATLSRDGKTVASAEFTINNTSDPNSPNAQVLSKTMLIVDVTEVADYSLAIEGVGVLAVTLESPQVELRRNIRRDK